MLFGLRNTLSSLTASPAAAAIDQAHRMAQRRLADGGTATGRGGTEKKAKPADLVLPDDVDAAAVAQAIRAKLDMPEPIGATDPLHPLERRKLGGRVVLCGHHLLRIGDGDFARGRAFMHRLVNRIHADRGVRHIGTR